MVSSIVLNLIAFMYNECSDGIGSSVLLMPQQVYVIFGSWMSSVFFVDGWHQYLES